MFSLCQVSNEEIIMSDTTRTSPYEALSPQRREIRLVRLHPADSKDAPIECSIHTVSLVDKGQKPSYEALSYVWGETTANKPIVLDGGPGFTVTANLHAALQRLRQRKSTLPLWIDAISINQSDSAEKSSQLALMSTIFQSADKVLVWLGESTPETKYAISNARALSQRWQLSKFLSQDSRKLLYLDFKALLSKSGKLQKTIHLAKITSGIWDLKDLTYWSRMWTFQEYQLPKPEPLCFCGDDEFYMWDMEIVYQSARLRLLTPPGESKLLGSPGLEKLRDERNSIIAANQTKEKDSKPRGLDMGFFLGRSRFPTNSLPLLKLLHDTVHRKCQDPRDRFYALHGLAENASKAYPADYSLPTRDVVLQNMAHILQSGEPVKNLEDFRLRYDRLKDDSEYPSWVPDLSSLVDSPGDDMNLYLTRKLSDKLVDDSHLPKLNKELTKATFTGRIVGRICRDAIVFKDSSEEIARDIANLDTAARAENLSSNPMEDAVTKCWSVPCEEFHKQHDHVKRIADLLFVSGSPSAPAPDMSQLMGVIKRQKETQPSNLSSNSDDEVEAIKQLATQALPFMRGRKLFATDAGLLGVGISAVEEGDVVALFSHYVDVPVVLRQISSPAGSGEIVYKLVSTAFIEGLFSGGSSGIDQESAVAVVLQAELQEFTLI